MNSFDIFAIIITGFCLIRGIFRGLVKELASIVGVMAGYYAAYSYYPAVTRFLSQWIPSTDYSRLIGFLLLFGGVFLVISILGVIIKYLMNVSHLGWTDRISGSFFGLLKGVLIVAVMFIVFTTFLPQNTSLIKDSFVTPHLSRLSTQMTRIVSKDMRREFVEKIESLQKAWKKN